MILTKINLANSKALFKLNEILYFCFFRSNQSLICQIPTFFNETKTLFSIPGTTSNGIISLFKIHSHQQLYYIHEKFDSCLCYFNSISSKINIKEL